MATANGVQATKVVTDRVRLSYVHVFEAFSHNPDQEAKFSVVLLIPKTDKKTIRAIRAAQQVALQQGEAGVFKGKIPKDWADTVRDGDDEDTLEKNPEYEGCWYMSVGSRTRPNVVDQDVNPILDSTQVYSGCYARVSMNAFPYSYSGKKGVSFGLNHVQKLADGEAFGGRSRAEDDFDVVEVDDDDDVI